MKKRIYGIVSVVVLLCLCCGCDSRSTAVDINTVSTVAVEYSSDSFLAASDYCNQKGYELVECASESEAVVFVENGKYDYVILDNLVAPELLNCGIEYVETCSYKVSYHLGFSADGGELCDRFNEAIASLSSDGTISEIKSNYLNNVPNSAGTNEGKFIRVLCCTYFDDRVYYDDNGVVCGVDADIMVALCNEVGYTPVFISAEYDELFSMLEEGKGDVLLMVESSMDRSGTDIIIGNAYLEKTFNVYKRTEA